MFSKATLVLAVLAFTLSTGLSLAQSDVYWTLTTTIASAPKDGSGPIGSVPAPRGPVGIDVDLASGKIYFGAGTSGLRSMNLDGSNNQQLPITGSQYPSGVSLDVGAGKIYWANDDQNNGHIGRANLDGSGTETLVTFGGASMHMEVDPIGGKMYWTTIFENPNHIYSADLDGSNMTPLFNVDAQSFAIDPANNAIYWADMLLGEQSIMRGNLDGTGTPVAIATDKMWVSAMDVDPLTGTLYYADTEFDFAGVVSRIDPDGSNDTVLYDTAGIIAYGLSVPIPEPATLSLLALGALGLIRRRR